MTTIVARPSPVRTDLYTAEIPDGLSLIDVLGDAPESVRAQIDGEVIPREQWAEPLPVDAQVLLTGTPEDDGLGRAIAMIGVSLLAGWAAPMVAGAIGVAGVTGGVTAVTAGLTMVGSLAVNALVPPEMPSQQSPTQPNVRNSITGTRNQVEKYGVVPRVYGNPRWYPKLAANPVTEIAGNDQYMRMLLVLGYGPLEVAGHRVGDGYSVLKDADVGDAITIGETNLGDYEDVEWEIGMPDQLTLMTPDIAEEQIGVALNAQGEPQADTWVPDGNSATRTTAPGTKEISIDLVFPQGVFCINDNGTRSGLDVEFKVEYREAGTTTWTVQDGNWLIGGEQGTKDTYRLNKRWSVPKGQYDVRVTRVRSRHGGVQAIYTDCQWSVLRSVQNGPAYTGNHVLMALRIRATDQLNGVIDQLRIRTQAVLRVWDGAAWVMQATNNPGWAYIDAMTGQQVGNPIGDDRLHLEDIVNWAAFCDAHASPLEYHHVHDGDETVLDRARSIAAAGQGSFAFRDGKFGIVFDDPNTPTVQAITPRNASGFSSSIQYKDLPHGIRVKYVDPDTWSDAERIVYRPGYDESNATRFEDFQLQGVASSEEAWDHGNYHLRQAILRPETFKASMDWENLAIVRGNRVLYQYDAILVGLGSARVKSVSGTTIVLDERLEYTEQRAYGISVRGVDDAAGKAKLIATQVTGAEIGETDTFTSVDSIDVEPGDLVIYGVMGKESIDAKVTRIEPNEDFGADLTLVNAAPDIYDYTTAPVFDPGITNPIPPDRVRPPVPHITSVRGDETAAQQNQDGSFTTLIRVAYAFNTQVGLPNLQVEARYRVVGSDEWEHAGPFTTSGNLTIRDVDEELDYEIQLRALNGSMASVWSQTATLTVTGQAVQVPQSIEVQRGTFSLTLIPHGLYSGAQYEFFRSSAPLALGDVETSAQRLSVGAVLVDTDLMPDTTYYYYVRQWTVSRVSAFAAVEATTKNDPSAIISNISGEIHEGVLDPALRERVEQVGINQDAITAVQGELDQTQQDLAGEASRLDDRVDTVQGELDQTQQDLNDEAARLDGRVDTVQTGLNQTQQDLADEANRLDGRVDTVQGNLNDEASRLDGRVSSVQNSLEATRNNLEAADADLDQRLDAAETAIVEEAEVRRSEDAFTATRLEGLQDTADEHDLRIGSLQRVQQEGDALDAIIYEALNAETANRRASIRTEERVRVDGDSALAVRADSLEASVGDLDAAITTEQQARADEDSALASQIGELSAKVDALPQFASGFEAGSDFDQWQVASTDTLTADTSNVYAGLQSGLITSTASNPSSTGNTDVTYAEIPAGATEAFEGFEITVAIAAVQPASNAAAEFAVAYSTASVGNSQWQRFTPTSTWSVFEFSWTVPEGSSGTTDYIAIWGDTSGAGLGVIVDGVRVRRVAGEVQEITAALQQEQQARIDGDDALASDLSALTTRVGDNESGLTAEQQARADADSAVASDIQDMGARVGDVESGLTTEQQVRADADSALASRASSLESRTDDVEAGLTSEEQARTNADEALGSRLTAVEATSGDNAAAITEEAEVRATEDEAHALALDRMSLSNQQQSAAIAALRRLQQEGDAIEAIQFEGLNVETANRRASIRTEERVRTDEDSALAVRADQLEAGIGDNSAAITAEQQARADGDSALASDLSSLDTRVGNNESSITTEQQARISGDNALASDISSLGVRVGDNESAITTEERARIDEDNALASRASSLESRMSGAESDITSEAQTRADADSALASRATSLESRMGTAESDITQEQQARSDADSALAVDLASLDTRVGDNASSITTEQQARADGDSALASDISSLDSRMGSAESAITAEEQARVDADSTLASRASSLETRMNGAESDIVTEEQARIDGDNALASRASSLETRMDGAESSITQEQTARSDGDDALAQDISNLQTSMGDDYAALQTQLEAEITGQSLVSDGAFSAGDTSQWGAASSPVYVIDSVNPGGDGGAVATNSPSRYFAEFADSNHGTSRHIHGEWRSVSAGDAYSVKMDYTARAGTDGSIRLNIQWRDSSGSVMSANNVATKALAPVSSGSWATTEPQTVTAPSGAKQARVVVSFLDDSTTGSACFTNVVASRTDAAMARRIDTVQTQIDDADAAIQAEQTARIDGDNALASDISTVQTQLGEDIASVEQTAQANIDEQKERINAMWALRLDVNGRVTGIGLANDGTETEFGINADRMYIADPDDPDSADLPFIFDNGRLLLKEALIDQLTFGKLVDGSGNFIVDSNGRVKADYLQLSDSLQIGGGANEVVNKTNWEDGDQGAWSSSNSQVVNISPVGTDFPVPYTKALQIENRNVWESGNSISCSSGDRFHVYAVVNAYWANGPVSVGLQFKNASGSTTAWAHPTPVSTGGNWVQHSGSITAPSDTVEAVPWMLIDAAEGQTGYAKVAYASIQKADSGVTRITASGIQIIKPDGETAVNISPDRSDFSGNVNVEGLTVNGSAPSFVFSDSYSSNNTIHYIWGQSTTDANAPLIEDWRSAPEGIRFWAENPYNGDSAQTYVTLIDRTYTVNARGPSSSAFINLDVDLQCYVRAFLEDTDRSTAMAEFDGELLVYDGGDLVRRSVIIHSEDRSRGFSAEAVAQDAVNTSTTVAIKLKETNGDIRIVFRLRGYCYTQRYSDRQNATFIFESRRCEMDALISRI